MPKAPPLNPLRFISPGMLVFCFILFFLPWIEMTCTLPSAEVKKLPKEKVDEVKKELGFDPTKPVSMVSQSGLQIATGDTSPGSDMKKMEEKMKKMGEGFESEKSKDKNKDDLKGAPLLFLYPVLLIAGIAAAFVPIPTNIRRLALAGCCGAALGVILLQALIGFPMENEIKKKTDEMKEMSGGGMFGGGKAAKADTKSDTKSDDIIRVSWKFWLYLTFLLLLGAAGAAFVDGEPLGTGGARYGRKKRRDDYDEWDDDEDDRPRKKRRRDEDDHDDDDEDDRPRKKKQEAPLSLDDDEPPPPPKKTRRDEEDEDDRPRKKAAPPPPPAAPAAPASGNPFDFGSDDPPPKKKPPRRRDDDEDDDDDDRPRKKRRRDDD